MTLSPSLAPADPLSATTLLNPLSADPRLLRTLVVAADPLTRAGLVALLNTQSGVTVVGQTAISEVNVAITAYLPQVMVWDAGSKVNESVRALIEADDLPPLVILIADPEDVAPIWLAGIHGILLRNAKIEQIAASLFAVANRLTVLDPGLTGQLITARDRMDLPVGIGGRDLLTAREIEVLQALSEGLPNKIIAQRLGISDSTVKFHINAIMGKLGAQSRTDAVVRATRLGLIVL